MISPVPKSKLKLLSVLGFGAVIVLGLVLAFVPATKPTASTIHPQSQTHSATTTSPATPSNSATASSSPAVAGDATSPTITPSTPTHPQDAAQPSHNQPAAPTSYVILQIASSSTSTFNINYTSGLDACNILTEAKNEGKITSVTLAYYPSFQSYYVKELNGLTDGWTFNYNGSSPPVGCSKVPLHAGDTVTWLYKR